MNECIQAAVNTAFVRSSPITNEAVGILSPVQDTTINAANRRLLVSSVNDLLMIGVNGPPLEFEM